MALSPSPHPKKQKNKTKQTKKQKWNQQQQSRRSGLDHSKAMDTTAINTEWRGPGLRLQPNPWLQQGWEGRCKIYCRYRCNIFSYKYMWRTLKGSNTMDNWSHGESRNASILLGIEIGKLNTYQFLYVPDWPVPLMERQTSNKLETPITFGKGHLNAQFRK